MKYSLLRTLLAYLNRNKKVPEGAIKYDVPMCIFNYEDEDYEFMVNDLKNICPGITVEDIKDCRTTGDFFELVNRGDKNERL
jgi:hypothetical protein